MFTVKLTELYLYFRKTELRWCSFLTHCTPITNSPSSSEVLKSTPSGTISTAMKHFPSDDDENNSNLVDKKSTIKSNVGSSARPVKRTRRNKPPTKNACDTPSTATRSSKRLKSLHK
ncbi:hypothetical protein G6F43_014265 [Rhizopus delemar]|nr:hypothetical protein G6F43_014265 [Rhizopus delemar]